MFRMLLIGFLAYVGIVLGNAFSGDNGNTVTDNKRIQVEKLAVEGNANANRSFYRGLHHGWLHWHNNGAYGRYKETVGKGRRGNKGHRGHRRHGGRRGNYGRRFGRRHGWYPYYSYRISTKSQPNTISATRRNFNQKLFRHGGLRSDGYKGYKGYGRRGGHDGYKGYGGHGGHGGYGRYSGYDKRIGHERFEGRGKYRDGPSNERGRGRRASFNHGYRVLA